MKEVKIAYIGGGSKAWAQILMKDLLLQDQICGEVKLFDTDLDAAKKNELVLNKLCGHDKAKSKWEVSVSESLETVLPGSDFIVLSILPGTFDDMTVDVHSPELYGIYQSVGDTVGPGGYRRALRLFDNYVPIAEAIKAYAPDAWVINYTNPMTLSMKILNTVFPGIKAIGCCHEVFGTQKLLAKAYKTITGAEQEIDRHEIHVNVKGINHFTWIDEATYQGQDLLPIYRQFVEEYRQSGTVSEGQSVTEKNVDYFASMDKVKMDLFNRYGVIAAAGDRHLAEFMAADYLTDPEKSRNDWAFDLTPVSWRIENDVTLLDNRDKMIAGELDPELTASDEEGANIMIALAGVRPFVTNANYPNVGQMPDAPMGAIVETNIAFSGGMAKPLMAGPMTHEVRDLVTAHIDVQEAFTEAYMNRDKEALKAAYMKDPAICRLTEDQAKELTEAMIGTRS